MMVHTQRVGGQLKNGSRVAGEGKVDVHAFVGHQKAEVASLESGNAYDPLAGKDNNFCK